MGKKPVLLLTPSLSPYRIALFNHMSLSGDYLLKVVCLASVEKNREWELNREQIRFDCETLLGWHVFVQSKEFPIHLNWGLWRILKRYDPEVIIISGYYAPSFWEAFLYCKLSRKECIFWNETTLLSTHKTGGLIGWLKRIMIEGVDRYVAYGTKAAEYLIHMGATEERIHVGPNTVDMEWFAKQARAFYESEALQRERVRYPKFLLLYVGQLINRKGIFQVLKALSNLNDSEIGFLIVGSGQQEPALKQFSQDLGLQNIYFEGFRQKEALPRYYALADVFILPAFEEVWGLVVNEALASGLYVLSSDRAGAAHDLIKEEWNGALFDAGNVEEIAESILMAKNQLEEIRGRRGLISEHACCEFSISRSAKPFSDAINCGPDLARTSTQPKRLEETISEGEFADLG